jgi:hypothetical protein
VRVNSGELVVQLRFRALEAGGNFTHLYYARATGQVGCGLELFVDREDYGPPELVRDRLLGANFLQEESRARREAAQSFIHSRRDRADVIESDNPPMIGKCLKLALTARQRR